MSTLQRVLIGLNERKPLAQCPAHSRLLNKHKILKILCREGALCTKGIEGIVSTSMEALIGTIQFLCNLCSAHLAHKESLFCSFLRILTRTYGP